MSAEYEFKNKLMCEKKIRFLNAVSGNKIVEEQAVINSSPDMAVFATQLEKRDSPKIKNPDDEKPGFIAYDVWIYYYEKKQMAQPTPPASNPATVQPFPNISNVPPVQMPSQPTVAPSPSVSKPQQQVASPTPIPVPQGGTPPVNVGTPQQ